MIHGARGSSPPDKQGCADGVIGQAAAEIIQSNEPVTLNAASYVKRQVYTDHNGDQYNKIEVAREAIAFAIDL